MYGEQYGTSTLARQLMKTSERLYYDMDNGIPYEQLREDAQRMMEGSIVLWKEILEEVADERQKTCIYDSESTR